MTAGSAPPPAVIAAGGVFLPAHVCHPLWLVLRRELDRQRGNGGTVRPEVAAALEALRAAALDHLATVSATGHPTRTSPDTRARSERKLVTTGQLAVRLGVTSRHARRLAQAAGLQPAARGFWYPDDAAHLVELRRKDH